MPRHSPAPQPRDSPHLRALKLTLELGANERRVAHDVAAFLRRQQCRPIDLQRIAVKDRRATLQRDAGIVGAERLVHFIVGDMVHHPHRDLGDARREFFIFDAVELIDGDAAE